VDLARVVRWIVVAVVAVLGVAALRAQPPARRTHLVIVVDGLRPDYVTPEVMPRLVRLGRRGVVFNAHHSVFPTVTRVNAAAIATGAYPEAHGLLGNIVYVPAANAIRGLDTASRANLEAIAQSDGRLLTARSLGEILHQARKKVLVVGSGSSGSALLLNHTVGNGAIVHHEYTRPPELAARVLETLGPPPARAMPNAAQNRRAVDAYLTLGLEQIRPDVTLMWISDPDTTAHTRGMGAGPTRDALTLVDTEIGRIEDTLKAKGLLDRTNLVITSDHGFSTHTGTFGLAALVEPFIRRMPDGSPDIVVAEGAVHFRRGAAPRPPSSPRCSSGRRWAQFSRAPADTADMKAWCPARCRLRWRGGIIRALPRFWSPPTGPARRTRRGTRERPRKAASRDTAPRARTTSISR
jgi:predicted AlkP superfamily pyrophosphatase or phosphodiesterase